jgi:ABC-type uncharacterized transport system permease subunit
MFMGVALMQSFTGWLASAAVTHGGWEPYRVVMAAISIMLVLGALLFRFLPQPGGSPPGSHAQLRD